MAFHFWIVGSNSDLKAVPMSLGYCFVAKSSQILWPMVEAALLKKCRWRYTSRRLHYLYNILLKDHQHALFQARWVVKCVLIQQILFLLRSECWQIFWGDSRQHPSLFRGVCSASTPQSKEQRQRQMWCWILWIYNYSQLILICFLLRSLEFSFPFNLLRNFLSSSGVRVARKTLVEMY